MHFKRVATEGNMEFPVSLMTFLETGKVGENFTAIILYDELMLVLHRWVTALQPFFGIDTPPSTTNDEEIVMVPIKVRHLRYIKSILKNA